MNIIQERLKEKKVLILDGAMGTALFESGLTTGDSPEEWNITKPKIVQSIHRAYIEAGSDLILTNSFGGSRFRLQLHGLEKDVEKINLLAGQNAKIASEHAPHSVLIGGSIGPSGELLTPLGLLTSREASEGFAEQGKALDKGGVDLLWFETFSSLEEVEAGVRGVKEVSDLPIIVTMSFDTAGKTMMGVSGEEMGERLSALEINAIGVNCGANLDDSQVALLKIKSTCGNLPLISKVNAGIPEWKDGHFCYNGTPEIMATYAAEAYVSGASLIGACCGSTPEHVLSIGKALRDASISS